ncbi:ABC transporter ATP-binding protein [Bosea sp. (in: a-proteobacteria)]|uniref:ABC transporter ATP-binding protein n=1 Tax=Bosea sp. (in: a-proteobacteria) TaxID=1871050 RepID=UPI002DDD6BFC|nr:ABC transporter ATP-binding protein [Bosea sp. (in: a-proteobacteria)]HEV2510768.1 ABC transporter ATP-binding protein [Bosea sp. (in: a-proteobacteria)]
MLLDIRNLIVELPVGRELRRIVADVSLGIGEGESLALVGESGSGKSMTTKAITRTLPAGARVSGEVRFDGRLVGAMSERELESYRREQIGLIYQDPRAHINPVRRIEDFLLEGLLLFDTRPRAVLRQKVADLLQEVGIADPDRCLGSYPHQLSGGMLQRVAIAAALSTQPRLLLADESTTALDVTTQAEVALLLKQLQTRRGLSVLFITHDLDLAAQICDRTAVMYAGRIVEMQPSRALYAAPAHPYTKGLLQSRPSVDRRYERLPTLPGSPTPAYEAPAGCPFAPRCTERMPICSAEVPPLKSHGVAELACHLGAAARGGN